MGEWNFLPTVWLDAFFQRRKFSSWYLIFFFSIVGSQRDVLSKDIDRNFRPIARTYEDSLPIQL